jgi:hypothetical protein
MPAFHVNLNVFGIWIYCREDGESFFYHFVPFQFRYFIKKSRQHRIHACFPGIGKI